MSEFSTPPYGNDPPTPVEEKPNVNRLQNRLFDAVVIGGGIAGLSAARQVAMKGYDTLLLEQSALGAGASSNNLRIIHGGLRYLSRFNLLQMIESLKDQALLLREAPSLVKSLPCIIPFERGGFPSKFFIRAASFIYNHIAELVTGNTKISQVVEHEFIERYASLIAPLSSWGGLLWYDARIRDPQKLHALMAHKLDREGGDLLTGARVIRIVKEGALFRVVFVCNENEFEVVTRVVINTSGYQIASLPVEGVTIRRKPIVWARAFNVVLKDKLEDRFAVGFKGQSGRQFFIVPRGNASVLGTGYLPYDVTKKLAISPEEIESFLTEPQKILNKVLTSFSYDLGVIPVRSISEDGSKIAFLGRSQIYDFNGYIEVVTTKYSGFYALGKRIAKMSSKYLR